MNRWMKSVSKVRADECRRTQGLPANSQPRVKNSQKEGKIMTKFNNRLLALGSLVALSVIAPAASYALGDTASAQAKTQNVNVVSARELNPFQATQTNSTDLFAVGVDFTVPAGKRLIIEFASVKASLRVGEKLSASISATNAGTETTHQIVMSSQQSTFANDLFAGAEQMLMYADAGSTVRIEALRQSILGGGQDQQPMRIDASISGYLVDLP
jgi:hypothetical protein